MHKRCLMQWTYSAAHTQSDIACDPATVAKENEINVHIGIKIILSTTFVY